ncbi:LysR family transcriptional regulator [Achromobacter denitrificans]|uniref:LysR family transcriptional regulator n=1 Tax=Achromobacter denitrificans TaxID=32002 RepID=A0ABZ3G1U9_ACHDE|nr:LysR family transcriptional regulator [Achromobacter denitrificans]MDX3877173.1 LysR family transcriptional regulator [Achromobacter sp.]MBV2160040.1 LysR family transcriptional regulator [Achromobacter denitrificans]MDF3847051.1 LysR family transcriptional regulator [Achromobacter denitrificans]MDF3860350.1 LysR family transcriptional regulator [Achromobacter denitrificans]QCS63456.1 LysR family transcriptional regulator [Achromobacter denitrificans]
MAKPSEAPDWDLRALRIFSLVARSGSITKVAIDLGVSQPAISRYLSMLEKQCGGYLFTRNGRGVGLTELGKQVQPVVEQVLASASDLNDVIAAAHGRVSGTVRIGTLPSLSNALIVPLLLRLQREYPAIHVQIVESAAGQIESWLQRREIDIGLPYRSHDALGSDEDVLLRLPSYLIGPPGDRITAARQVPFAKLDGLPLVLSRKPSSVRMMLDEMGRRNGVDIRVTVEADSGFIQKQMVVKRSGYTLLPWHFVAAEVERGELQAAEIVEPAVVRIVSLMLTDRPTQAVKVVTALLREIVSESLAQLDALPPEAT